MAGEVGRRPGRVTDSDCRHRTFQGAGCSRRAGARRSQASRLRELPPGADPREKTDRSLLVPQWLEKWEKVGRGVIRPTKWPVAAEVTRRIPSAPGLKITGTPI